MWALPQVGAGGLFQPPSVKDQLNNPAKATLGVLMDTSKVNETIQAVHENVNCFIEEWVAFCEGVGLINLKSNGV